MVKYNPNNVMDRIRNLNAMERKFFTRFIINQNRASYSVLKAMTGSFLAAIPEGIKPASKVKNVDKTTKPPA